MESLFLLIPISVGLVFLIAILFWWSVKGGQFDDLEGPGFRIIMDDDRVKSTAPEDLANSANVVNIANIAKVANVVTNAKPVDPAKSAKPATPKT